MKRIFSIVQTIPDFITQIIFGIVKNNDSNLAKYLRRLYYKTECNIDTNVTIKNRSNFFVGHNSSLYNSCYILNTYGHFTLGNNSHLGAFCYVNVCYGKVNIGDDVAIGPGTKIIAYSNHYKKGSKISEERITIDIVIGNNVFIGANCVILPGAIINDNVIIGAGSVVKGELDKNSIYIGIPCKKIRTNWY